MMRNRSIEGHTLTIVPSNGFPAIAIGFGHYDSLSNQKLMESRYLETAEYLVDESEIGAEMRRIGLTQLWYIYHLGRPSSEARRLMAAWWFFKPLNSYCQKWQTARRFREGAPYGFTRTGAPRSYSNREYLLLSKRERKLEYSRLANRHSMNAGIWR